MQGSNQEDEVRRKRNQDIVRIRRENRNHIFSSKRFRKDDKAPSSDLIPASTEQFHSQQEDRQMHGHHKDTEIRAKKDRKYQPELYRQFRSEHMEETDPTTEPPNQHSHASSIAVHIVSLSERAEQLYGSKYRASEWCYEQHESNKVVDDDLYDFILETQERSFTMDDLLQALQCFKCDEDYLMMHRGAIMLRKIICKYGEKPEGEFLLVQLIDQDILPRILEMMRQTVYKQLRLEAAWIIGNMTNDAYQCEKIVQRGGIEQLLNLLKTDEPALATSALWGLANIAADKQQFKNMILDLNGLHAIVELGENTKSKRTLENCVWAVANLLSGIDVKEYNNEIKESLSFLCRGIQCEFINDDLDDFQNIISVLRVLAQTYCGFMAQTGIIPALLKLCIKEPPLRRNILEELVRLVTFFAEENKTIVELMVKQGAIEVAHQLILNNNQTIVADALFILSSIAATSARHTEMVIECKDVMETCRWLMKSENANIVKEAIVVLGNISILGKPSIVFAVYRRLKVLEETIEVLLTQQEDSNLTYSAAELLLVILECGNRVGNKVKGENVFKKQLLNYNGGLQCVFDLQRHQDDKVYSVISHLIDEFFPDNTEKDQIDNFL